jgi:hypothetical protein
MVKIGTGFNSTLVGNGIAGNTAITWRIQYFDSEEPAVIPTVDIHIGWRQPSAYATLKLIQEKVPSKLPPGFFRPLL